MKKIIASASLAAVGAVGLQAALAPGVSSAEQAKPWNVSASLRGFYDDNYTTRPEGLGKKNSFGIEVSPAASFTYTVEQNVASLSYIYGMRYYENRQQNSIDQSHQVNARLEHTFSEQYKLDLTDSFVVGQEPELLDPSAGFKYRADGSNIRNTAIAKFHAELTRLFGLEVGYGNTLYSFDDPAYALFLDRMEHLAHLDLRWHALPLTWGVLGYQYGVVDYTHAIESGVDPTVRNSRSHYVYVGADHALAGGKINTYGRVGAQFIEYPNADKIAGAEDSSVVPYADFGATWAYMRGSFLQLGIKHTLLATDFYAFDQEATTLYGQVSQKITEKLTCSLNAQYQNSSFNFKGNSAIDGKVEDYFLVGLNFAYQIMTAPVAVTAETGYNLDVLDSEIAGREFTRNRVYLGLRASY